MTTNHKRDIDEDNDKREHGNIDLRNMRVSSFLIGADANTRIAASTSRQSPFCTQAGGYNRTAPTPQGCFCSI
ncbi:MAG: hypothetical protein A2289_17895 [Deltaproteobacteria bacterium RIFOXYA12_FULL_58_15]|nr:MAG: hypothetical protein A2289_17895 [Deltaproteobacteria bacterium RIFOXYA12_FULL_58_15]OGR09051.1 MAG: hypothetical protein A2341_25805 [Deltaproteobacteria bacterium RIFOXYB12_FULL_58_9]